MATEKTHRPVVYDMTSEQCIWSAAGVVPYRLCSNGFDCTTCSYDQRMLRKQNEGVKSWRNRSRQAADPETRRCRHMLSGYVSAKYCPNNFDCNRCEFDQLVHEEMLSQKAREPQVEIVEGFALAPDHYYTRAHAWARLEYGGQIRVGMDDFASRLFGPAHHWKLPDLGRALTHDEVFATMTRSENAASLNAPIQGIVAAVNPRLESNPGLVNQAPYSDGWLVILQPTKLVRDFRQLLFGKQAEGWLKNDSERLSEIIYRERQHRLAATGGRIVQDIFGSVDGLRWDELVDSFLKS